MNTLKSWALKIGAALAALGALLLWAYTRGKRADEVEDLRAENRGRELGREIARDALDAQDISAKKRAKLQAEARKARQEADKAGKDSGTDFGRPPFGM